MHLQVPNTSKVMKMKKSNRSEVENKASNHKDSVVTKGKELDKDNITKQHLYQTKIKIGKYTASFTIQTKVKRQ